MQHNLPWAEAYLRIKWHIEPSSRLATDMGRKLGAVPHGGGGAGSCGMCRGLPLYQVVS